MTAGLLEGRRSEAIMFNALRETKRQMCICPRNFVRPGVSELDGSPCCVPGCITCTQLAHRVRNFGQIAWEIWAVGEYLPLHASMLVSKRHSDRAVTIARISSAVHLVLMLQTSHSVAKFAVGKTKKHSRQLANMQAVEAAAVQSGSFKIWPRLQKAVVKFLYAILLCPSRCSRCRRQRLGSL